MDITALGIAVTATVGVVEVLKKTGLNSRLFPVLSLVVGFGMTLLFTHSLSWASLQVGILTGITASGAYSGVSTIVKKTTATTQA